MLARSAQSRLHPSIPPLFALSLSAPAPPPNQTTHQHLLLYQLLHLGQVGLHAVHVIQLGLQVLHHLALLVHHLEVMDRWLGVLHALDKVDRVEHALDLALQGGQVGLDQLLGDL